MKKTFTKAFALILMGVFATTMAFAQGAGGHDHTNVEKWKTTLAPDEKNYAKGPEWELFYFPEYDSNGNIVEVDGKKKLRSINYYNGGKYDDLTIDKFKGGHWKGHTINELKEGEEFFLCNMETGEYLQIGDYWGTNEMTNHVGITYQLTKAYSQRKKENNPAWNDDPAFGYWLSPKMPGSDMPNRVIGRVTVNDGEQGHFERNKYFVLRDRDEYHDGKYVNWQNNANTVYTSGDKDYDGSSISDPGGFLFYFHPVEKDGKQAYVIYTHRQTQYANSSNKNRSEFWDRESYLMLKSAGHLRTGYNAVRFEKFAGQMYGKSEASYNGIKLNFSRTGGVAPSNVSVTVKDFSGTAISGASAELVSTGFGDLMNRGQSAITVGTVLAPDNYDNGENSEIVYTFRVKLPSTSSYKFNAAALDVYNMSSAGNAQQLSNNEDRARNFQFSIKMGSSLDALSAFAEKTEETNIVDGANVPNSFGGLRYGTQQLVVGTEVSSATEFYIQVTLKKTSVGGCYAGIGEIQLYDSKNVTVNTGGTWGDSRDNRIGDETNFSVNYVSITDALDEESNFYVGNDKNNLWKIVTKSERERFRLVASEDKPSDMTYRIYNPKFYTSYTYVWKKNQCTDLGGGKYTHPNDLTDYHWQWFDDDRKTPLTPNHHVHPYDITYNDTRANEYHKIGTGFFHRFWASGIGNANVKERAMTLGQESNYVGSIWKGTANLQQEVGTLTNPLREGLYVVCVKGFFAPHDMEKYDGAGNCNSTATTSALDTSDEWYKEAIITNGGEDNGKWRRSHDSYLFAWSNPDGKNPEEVRRMLPSIYEGAIDLNSVSEAEKSALSKEGYLELDDFKKYSQLGVASGDEAEAKKNLLKDATNFAKYSSAFFGKETGTWSVPKTLSAAGRWFNVIDGISPTSSATFKNAQAYRIALPVYVGSDGLLTIGVDHTKNPSQITVTDGYADIGTADERPIQVNIPASGNDEWVCFDDFELIYLGKVEPDVFVVDERHGSALNMVEPRLLTDGTTGEPYPEGDPNYEKYSNDKKSVVNKNNTQWKDIFSNTDIALEGKTATIVKTLVIRRTLTKNGWGSIVFPVNLTYGHLKEGFGEDVQVSKLAGFDGRIIQYEPVQRDAEGNPVADDEYIIEAGVPYIIRPTIDPVIPANSDLKYKRPSFTKAYSTSPGLAGYYLRNFDRNYEVEIEMAGPIYVIPNVNVQTSVSFPLIDVEQYEVEEGGIKVQKERRNEGFDPEILAKQDTTWASIKAFDSKERLNKTYKVNRSDAPGHYKLVETAHYYPGEKIPQYSYFFSGGKMYYTTNPDGVATTRGLFSYLQLIGADDAALPVYSKPFIDGADTFIEVLGETNGIEDVNAPEPDGKLEIYDLMGRKVSNPRPGTIYIMNGVKVLWK